MFNKEIEFSAHEDYFSLKEEYPIPAYSNIPEWYKKLTHTVDNFTVKGCMPFLDSLTAGYILKVPQDFALKHNIDEKNEKGEMIKNSYCKFAMQDMQQVIFAKSINLNSHGNDIHVVNQLKESPLIEKNKNLPVYKILNPWRIKTPEGYSCLFVPPLNNSDDRFSIIPAIVDTDQFPTEINFPFIINGDKYPVLETIIKKGTPYVQVIPFKRNNWKLKLKPTEQKKLTNLKLFYPLKIFNNYKNTYWRKKTWR